MPPRDRKLDSFGKFVLVLSPLASLSLARPRRRLGLATIAVALFYHNLFFGSWTPLGFPLIFPHLQSRSASDSPDTKRLAYFLGVRSAS